MTYEKEVSVYNQGAVKNGIENAEKTATRFITDDTDGIFVHPEGEGPNDTTTPTGWRIRDALELLKTGISYFKAWIDSSNIARVRVGREDAGNVEISSKGLKVRAGNGMIDIADIMLDVSIDADGFVSVDSYYTFGSRDETADIGGESFVAGDTCEASAAYSAAFGQETATGTVGGFVCGHHNKKGNFLFSVGKGEAQIDGMNSNAITVDGSGNVAVAGKMQAITAYSTTATRAMFLKDGTSVTSESVAAGGTLRVEINVARTGYTPMAIAGVQLTKSAFTYYTATLSGGSAVLYIKNNGGSAATTGINLVVFYIATTAV